MEDKSKLQKNSGIRSHRNHGTRDLARVSFPWLAVAPREFSVPLADHPHFTSVLLGSATTTSLGHELLRQPKLSSIMGNVRRQIVVRSNASGSRKRRDDAMHATAKKKPSGAAPRSEMGALCFAWQRWRRVSSGSRRNRRNTAAPHSRAPEVPVHPLQTALPAIAPLGSTPKLSTSGHRVPFCLGLPPTSQASYRSLASRRVVRGWTFCLP